MSSKRANRWDWRSEAKRNSIFLFDVLSDCLLIWWFDVRLLCVIFIFFFQQSDVSTLKQKDDYCRNHLMSKMFKKEDWLLIVVVVDSLRLIDSKKEDRLLIEMSKIRERRSTIDCRCSKLTDWLTFKTRKSIID